MGRPTSSKAITDLLLTELGKSAPLPLHLPAHGRGSGLAPALRRLLKRSPGSWDLPELPSLGGPLLAEGVIAEVQQHCATLLAADRCWLGVNGASGLLQAALLGMAPPGSRVLMPRNLHRSLLHACVLGGLVPLLFDLPFDPLTGLWQPPSPEHLERVLKAAFTPPQRPPVALVLLDPTYQGLASELNNLVALGHRAGLSVLVDQAHGNGGAVAAGADLVVLSPQKAAGGLAQSAVLLASGDRVEMEAMERSLLWLQTSSPSALLLASGALALAHGTSEQGLRQRRRAEGRAGRLWERLASMGFPLVSNADPLRLVLATAAMGINGLQADAWLMARGVIAECPEPGTLTFCLGLAPPRGVEHRLVSELVALRGACGGDPLAPFLRPPLPLLAEPVMSLHLAWRAPAVSVPLEACAGRIAAEPVCPYPPGIPLLVPGEVIDPCRAAWLLAQQGQWPGQIADTVRVVAGM